MKADVFYNNPVGRAVLKGIMKSGSMKVAAWYMNSPLSKPRIRRYIKKNGIDMSDFKNQNYSTFAEFFARKKDISSIKLEKNSLISPCDSLLSIYPIDNELIMPMKGSHYRLQDLIPDKEYAKQFDGGLCFVFRLEASDYHHFCYIDNGVKLGTEYIPGELHSVQPIACEKYPVFKLNRRWLTKLETEMLGNVAQIEIGAMVVGGVTHTHKSGHFFKADEMGNFELAGSTIVVIIGPDSRANIQLNDKILPALNGKCEVRVKIAEKIGTISD